MPTLQVAIDARKAKDGSVVFTASAESIKRAAEKASRSTDGMNDKLKHTETVARSVKRALIGFTAGIGAAFSFRKVYQEISQFEIGLVGVGKTADLVGDELTALGDDVIYLSTKIPVGTAQLLSIAQAAGQLGVKGSANILKFTDTVAKLGTASDLAGDEAATVLARMLNVTGEAVDSVDTLASVIVALGNNSAATEREIAHHATMVAQATAVYKTSSAEAAALGAALASLGARAELGGSSVGRAFRSIDAAIRGQGKELELLAELTGKTQDEITKIFRKTPIEAFGLFLKGLRGVIETGGDATATLAKFGLQGEEILKILPTLAVNYEIVGNSLEIVNEELENTSALETEAARAFDTLDGSTTRFINTISAVILKLKGTSGPLSDFIDDLSTSVKLLFDLKIEESEVTDRSYLLADSIQFLAYSFAGLTALNLVSKLKSIGIVINGLMIAIQAHPIMAAVTAITLLASAMIAFGDRTDDATRKARKFKDELVDLSNVADSIGSAEAELQRAVELGDKAAEISATEAKIRTLEQASVELRKNLTEGKDLIELEELKILAPNINTEELEKQYEKAVEDAVDKIDLRGGYGFRSRERKRLLMLNESPYFAEDRKRDGLFLDYGTIPWPGPEGEKKVTRNLIDRRLIDTDYKAGIQFDEIASNAAYEAFSLNMVSASEGVQMLETEIAELNGTLEGLRTEQEQSTETTEELAKGYEGTNAALDELEKAAQKVMDKYNPMLVLEREKVQLSKMLGAGYIDQATYLKALADAQKSYNDALTSPAVEQMQALNDEIDFEVGLIGKVSEARERSIKMREYETAAMEAYGKGTAEYEAALSSYGEKLDLLSQAENFQEIADGMGRSFSNAFKRIIDGSQSATESLKDMAREIAALVMQKLLFDQIANAISGWAMGAVGAGVGATTGAPAIAASAYGNVFDRGQIIPFALGGIPDLIDKPTYFPMSGNNVGLAGEAGPEAVMPLSRGADGKLGVKAQNAAPVVQNDNRVSIVNKVDPAITKDFLETPEGERVILNIITRNPGVLNRSY